jgi:hypothetical protein
MRVTIRIDDDVFQAAKALAAHQKKPLGQVISNLMRKGLQPGKRLRQSTSFPVFPVPDGARPITLETVKQAEEEQA